MPARLRQKAQDTETEIQEALLGETSSLEIPGDFTIKPKWGEFPDDQKWCRISAITRMEKDQKSHRHSSWLVWAWRVRPTSPGVLNDAHGVPRFGAAEAMQIATAVEHMERSTEHMMTV